MQGSSLYSVMQALLVCIASSRVSHREATALDYIPRQPRLRPTGFVDYVVELESTIVRNVSNSAVRVGHPSNQQADTLFPARLEWKVHQCAAFIVDIPCLW